jgi:hypothetical protein
MKKMATAIHTAKIKLEIAKKLKRLAEKEKAEYDKIANS